MKKKSLKIIGIMSGTSLDGVDFVSTRVSSTQIKFLDIFTVKFPKKMREDLFDLAQGKGPFRKAQHLHFELGEFYYKSLQKAVKRKGWSFDAIALHGQTVYHNPPYATTQIGEPGYLKKFNVPVVSDFRSKLVCYKTEGAPLAPVFHEAFLKKNEGFLNLGGMSNITVKTSSGDLLATDLGPGNVFLDGAVKSLFNKEMDKGGRLSLQGLPNLSFVKSYIKESRFFKKKTPKSCGREEFSEKELNKLLKALKKEKNFDQLATLSEITIYPILQFLKKHKINKLYVSGGGAKNNYFMKRLSYELSGGVQTSDDLGWPVEAVEGGAFAYLAYKKIKKEKINLSYLGLSKKFSPLGRVD